METGDLSEWYFPSLSPTMINGGDVENSGNRFPLRSRDQAHTGSFSAALTITSEHPD